MTSTLPHRRPVLAPPGETPSPDDLAELDDLLLEPSVGGEARRMRELPAATILAIPPMHRFLWCASRARYGLPTRELVAELKGILAGRKAIEIGAGMGDLGRLLGIPMTDSAEQTSPDLRLYYAALGHAHTEPPPDVERLPALAAIAKHQPEVVLGSWCTQLYQTGDEGGAGAPKIGSSVFGIDELELLRHVSCYVHIGLERVHRDKRALALPHREIRAPWLVSRSLAVEENFIAIWQNERPVSP